MEGDDAYPDFHSNRPMPLRVVGDSLDGGMSREGPARSDGGRAQPVERLASMAAGVSRGPAARPVTVKSGDGAVMPMQPRPGVVRGPQRAIGQYFAPSGLAVSGPYPGASFATMSRWRRQAVLPALLQAQRRVQRLEHRRHQQAIQQQQLQLQHQRQLQLQLEQQQQRPADTPSAAGVGTEVEGGPGVSEPSGSHTGASGLGGEASMSAPALEPPGRTSAGAGAVGGDGAAGVDGAGPGADIEPAAVVPTPPRVAIGSHFETRAEARQDLGATGLRGVDRVENASPGSLTDYVRIPSEYESLALQGGADGPEHPAVDHRGSASAERLYATAPHDVMGDGSQSGLNVWSFGGNSGSQSAGGGNSSLVLPPAGGGWSNRPGTAPAVAHGIGATNLKQPPRYVPEGSVRRPPGGSSRRGKRGTARGTRAGNGSPIRYYRTGASDEVAFLADAQSTVAYGRQTPISLGPGGPIGSRPSASRLRVPTPSVSVAATPGSLLSTTDTAALWPPSPMAPGTSLLRVGPGSGAASAVSDSETGLPGGDTARGSTSGNPGLLSGSFSNGAMRAVPLDHDGRSAFETSEIYGPGPSAGHGAPTRPDSESVPEHDPGFVQGQAQFDPAAVVLPADGSFGGTTSMAYRPVAVIGLSTLPVGGLSARHASESVRGARVRYAAFERQQKRQHGVRKARLSRALAARRKRFDEELALERCRAAKHASSQHKEVAGAVVAASKQAAARKRAIEDGRVEQQAQKVAAKERARLEDARRRIADTRREASDSKGRVGARHPGKVVLQPRRGVKFDVSTTVVGHEESMSDSQVQHLEMDYALPQRVLYESRERRPSPAGSDRALRSSMSNRSLESIGPDTLLEEEQSTGRGTASPRMQRQRNRVTADGPPTRHHGPAPSPAPSPSRIRQINPPTPRDQAYHTMQPLTLPSGPTADEITAAPGSASAPRRTHKRPDPVDSPRGAFAFTTKQL